jgi:hypothetical protein
MLHQHVIMSGLNNPNSVVPIDLDDVIGEDSGEPFVKVIICKLWWQIINSKAYGINKFT